GRRAGGGQEGRLGVSACGGGGGVPRGGGGAPPMEGGIAVAPATFGRFGGDLIAPDEGHGLVYAVDPSGKVAILARSGRPAGGDIGVESAGFVPSGAGGAYLAGPVSAPHRPPAR